MITCPTCGNKVDPYPVPEINILRCPDCFHTVAILETKKASPKTKGK